MDVVGAVALGALFGWALHKAGLTHYARIVNVFRLRDLTVLRFMLTALATGAVAAQAGLSLGLAERLPLPNTAPLANLVGGCVFGVGMATAGLCPGTVAAEAGEGRLDAWTAGVAGLLLGALVFGLSQPSLMPALARVGAAGHVSVAALLGADPWLVLLVFCQLVALVLLVARDRGPAARA